jgi:hypothetical protein
MKPLLLKFSVGKLGAGNQTINLPGLNFVASCCFIYFRSDGIFYPNFSDLEIGWDSQICPFQINNVYITDGSGKNIFHSDLKNNLIYNRYLIFENFKNLGNALALLTKSKINYGEIVYLPFSNDGSSIFNDSGEYTGGYAFKNNEYKLNFTTLDNIAALAPNTNYTLYMLFYVPAVLELENGDLEEELA